MVLGSVKARLIAVVTPFVGSYCSRKQQTPRTDLRSFLERHS